MSEFLISLLCFLAAHVVPARTGLRASAMERFGRGPYMAAYSALSLGLVIWVISAAIRAPFVPLWSQAPWQAAIPLVVMPVALFLLFAGLAQPNPLSITMRHAREGEPLAEIVTITRHPVLWGFGLWALAHIPVNGDLVAVVLFGGFAVFAFAGMAILDRRHRRVLGAETWQALAARTSIVPFAAVLGGKTRLEHGPFTLAAIAAAVVAYLALILGGHFLLFGVDPIALL